MRKTMLFAALIVLLSVMPVSAQGHSLDEAKQLIDSGVGCDKLNNEQLEMLGDYYMEQMHSGEAHELMDKMMGGEGSESLRQMHIAMAKRLYCNEDTGGMMGSGGMMNMMGGNMMGGQAPQTSMMRGAMENGYGFGYRNFVDFLYVALLIGLVMLVFLGIIKLWRDLFQRRR